MTALGYSGRALSFNRLTFLNSAGRMGDKELQVVSGEDLEGFKSLVTEVYEGQWEQSYSLFRADVKIRLRRRGINPAYRSVFDGEMDDLVTRVFIRYSKVYGSMRRAGRKLESFEAMLEDRVKHVYYEAVRRYRKRLDEVPADDPDRPELAAPGGRNDSPLEYAEERRRLNKCMMECLLKLTEHERQLLVEYCDAETLSPQERLQARLHLSLREAKLSAESATPEQVLNARIKLRTAISRLRSDRLQPCKDKCLGLSTALGRAMRPGDGEFSR